MTELGSIVLELDIGNAPVTANHFLTLIENGLLQGCVFYRIVHDAGTGEPPSIDVVQGGLGWESTREIPLVLHETTLSTGLRHCDGAVSLARSPGVGGGSEFFICVADNQMLDATEENDGPEGGFAVFGKIVEGMDLVREIHGQPADRDPPGGDERFIGQFLTDYVAAEVQVLTAKQSN